MDGREGGRSGEGAGEGRPAEVIYGLATRDFPSARAGKSGSRVPSTSVHGRQAQCTAPSFPPPEQVYGEARMLAAMRCYSHLDKEYITCPGNNR